MKKCKWIALLLLVPLVLTSCADIFRLGFLAGTTPADQYDTYFDGISPLRGEIKMETADLSELNLEYSERELSSDYEKSGAARIVFADGGSTVYGKGAESNGKDVAITSGGTYIVSGSADGALLTVNAPKEEEVQLVLSGLTLTGKGGAAIDIRSAASLLLTLEGKNLLTNSAEGKPSAFDKESEAVILSRVDLCLNGRGSLTVVGNRAHGIASTERLTVLDGELTVSSTEVGLIGEGGVRIGGGELSVEAEEEGILSGAVLGEDSYSDYETIEKKSTGYIYISGGTITVVSTGDAISAESLFVMRDGVLDLTSGIRIEDLGPKEEPEETLPNFWDIFEIASEPEEANDGRAFVVFSDGVCAASDILIFGGTLAINASNHALTSGGSLCVDGGRFYLRAVHEGLCADGAIGISDGILILENSRVGVLGQSVDISGGYLYVGKTNCGVKTNEAFRLSGGVCLVAGAKELPLDFGVATATGGVLAALGNAKMAREFFPTGKQGTILCYFGVQGEKYPLLLCDNAGRVILSLEGKSEYSCAYFSYHELVNGNAYTLMSGGFVSGADKYGFALGAETSVAAEPLAVVTVNS